MNTPLQLKTLKIKKQFDIYFSNITGLIENWDLTTPIYYVSRVSPKDEILLRALDNVVTKLKLNSWNVDVIIENLREDFCELKLKITPKPDAELRLMMEFISLDNNIEVKSQELIKLERAPYTVVEWGGINYTNYLEM